MNDYNRIKKMVTKNKRKVYKKGVYHYCETAYTVLLKYDIYSHTHIDLEVATTHFKFDKNGILIDVSTYGWY